MTPLATAKADESRPLRWLHAALDRLGYLVFVWLLRIVRWQTALSALLWVVVPAFVLHVVAETTTTESGVLALLIAALHKLPEVLTQFVKTYLASSDEGHKSLVQESVIRHLRLLRAIERQPSAQMMTPLADRSEKERSVLTDSIRLIDAVMRERLRPRRTDDVHTTLRATDLSTGQRLYFYESDSEHLRHGNDIKPAHDLIFAAERRYDGSNGLERYKYSFWPVVTARRHMRALGLPAWYRECDSRSVLIVAVLSHDKNFDIDLVFESRHPYDFGSKKRNAQILRELAPFFVIIRLALQYRSTSEPAG